MDRVNSQPGVENFEHAMASVIAQFDSIIEATSVADLFEKLEQRGLLLRIDTNVEPSLYRCAIVSQAELAQLRRITNVVRLGRVRSIEPTRLTLEQGSLTADPDTLYIDCSSSAIQPLPDVQVFDRDQVNLLMVRTCQPVFSAALIAYVESHITDAEQQNALCRLVPLPEDPTDWLRMWAVTLANAAGWRQNEGLRAWLGSCRLNNVNAMLRGVQPDDAAKMAMLKETGVKGAAAAAKLQVLLASLAKTEPTRAELA